MMWSEFTWLCHLWTRISVQEVDSDLGWCLKEDVTILLERKVDKVISRGSNMTSVKGNRCPNLVNRKKTTTGNFMNLKLIYYAILVSRQTVADAFRRQALFTAQLSSKRIWHCLWDVIIKMFEVLASFFFFSVDYIVFWWIGGHHNLGTRNTASSYIPWLHCSERCIASVWDEPICYPR